MRPLIESRMSVRPVMRQSFDTPERLPNTDSAAQGGFL
jgi:hypothetical protein